MKTHRKGACLWARLPKLATAMVLGMWACAPAEVTSPSDRGVEVVQPLAGEVPRAAIDFSNSFGVVTHLAYTQSPYSTKYDGLIRSRLLESGIRHLREEATSGSADLVLSRYRDLANQGFDFSFICDPRRATPQTALAMFKQIGKGIGYIEGPNEYDHGRLNSAWVSEVQKYVKQLYTVVRADPLTRNVPILSPSFLHESTPGQVGNIAAFIDKGNIHAYSYPFAPNQYRQLQKMIARFSGIYGGKPFVVTETGYHTAAAGSDRPVSEAVQAKYLPRVFLQHFNAGVVRSYSYEFMDEGTEPIEREEHFGLLRYDGSRKPSFLAIRNLLTIVKDTKRPAVSQSLAYTVSPALSILHHTLLQHSNGILYLIFWLEAPSTDAVHEEPVKLTLSTAAAAITIYRPDRSSQPVASYSHVTQVNLKVPDSPVIVAITP